MLMDILRRGALLLAGGLLPLTLWTLAIALALIATFSDSANVKKIIADSGIYTTIVPNALNEASKNSGDSGEIPLTDPAVRQAAEKTFTPQFIQQNTESVIDSLYDWLDGKTAEPTFKLDLSSAKSNFANNVFENVQQKLATLPACPSNVSAQNFDAFSATCIPRGSNATVLAEQVKNELTSSQELLADPVISANDIKSQDDKPVFSEQWKKVPDGWQKFKSSPIVLGLISLLLAAAIILLSTSRRKGFRRVGFSLTAVGLVIILFAVLLNYGSNRGFDTDKLENKILKENVQPVVKDLSQTVGKSFYTIGGIYIALGLMAIFGPMLVGRRPKPQNHKENVSEPKIAEPPKKVEDKPESRRIKID